ncbi:MAG: pyrrolidone-carboxylate peptidase [Ardenticatenaceae bacterium]|nr:MAG: pyrrolidone-carboxylate peptidase [Ardenticatenaceae bacterium]
MKKFLVTGFEPFGQSSINPSEQVVQRLANSHFEEFEVATAVLPIQRTRGPEALLTAVQQTNPDGIICLGEAGGRHAISIERVAINLMDYGLADNDGQLVQDAPVVPDGPAAYFTTLPVRKLMKAVQNVGIPAELSLTAGAFLCNQVTYALLHHLAQQQQNIPAGFVHLPFLPHQAATRPRKFPSMALNTMETAVAAILHALNNHL